MVVSLDSTSSFWHDSGNGGQSPTLAELPDFSDDDDDTFDNAEVDRPLSPLPNDLGTYVHESIESESPPASLKLRRQRSRGALSTILTDFQPNALPEPVPDTVSGNTDSIDGSKIGGMVGVPSAEPAPTSTSSKRSSLARPVSMIQSATFPGPEAKRRSFVEPSLHLPSPSSLPPPSSQAHPHRQSIVVEPTIAPEYILSPSSAATSAASYNFIGLRRRPDSTIELGLSTLPAKIIQQIAGYFIASSTPSERLNCVVLSKHWSKPAIKALYKSPTLRTTKQFHALLQTLLNPGQYNYPAYIQGWILGAPIVDDLLLGDLDVALQLCPNLKTFCLEDAHNVSNVLIQSLTDNSRHLRYLSIKGCPISDVLLANLAKQCPKLEVLDLSYTRVTLSKGLLLIAAGCERLKKLSMRGCTGGVEETLMGENVMQMRRTSGSALKVLDFDHSVLCDVHLRSALLLTPNLTCLHLSHCIYVTDDSITRAITLCGHSLQVLDLSHCVGMTDLSLHAIASFAQVLRFLNIHGCVGVSMTGIRALARSNKVMDTINSLTVQKSVLSKGLLQLQDSGNGESDAVTLQVSELRDIARQRDEVLRSTMGMATTREVGILTEVTESASESAEVGSGTAGTAARNGGSAVVDQQVQTDPFALWQSFMPAAAAAVLASAESAADTPVAKDEMMTASDDKESPVADKSMTDREQELFLKLAKALSQGNWPQPNNPTMPPSLPYGYPPPPTNSHPWPNHPAAYPYFPPHYYGNTPGPVPPPPNHPSWRPPMYATHPTSMADDTSEHHHEWTMAEVPSMYAPSQYLPTGFRDAPLSVLHRPLHRQESTETLKSEISSKRWSVASSTDGGGQGSGLPASLSTKVATPPAKNAASVASGLATVAAVVPPPPPSNMTPKRRSTTSALGTSRLRPPSAIPTLGTTSTPKRHSRTTSNASSVGDSEKLLSTPSKSSSSKATPSPVSRGARISTRRPAAPSTAPSQPPVSFAYAGVRSSGSRSSLRAVGATTSSSTTSSSPSAGLSRRISTNALKATPSKVQSFRSSSSSIGSLKTLSPSKPATVTSDTKSTITPRGTTSNSTSTSSGTAAYKPRQFRKFNANPEDSLSPPSRLRTAAANMAKPAAVTPPSPPRSRPSSNITTTRAKSPPTPITPRLRRSSSSIGDSAANRERTRSLLAEARGGSISTTVPAGGAAARMRYSHHMEPSTDLGEGWLVGGMAAAGDASPDDMAASNPRLSGSTMVGSPRADSPPTPSPILKKSGLPVTPSRTFSGLRMPTPVKRLSLLSMPDAVDK